jgi:hypothetical protein
MSRVQASEPRTSRRKPAVYISPFDKDAMRWRHSDFEYNDVDEPGEKPAAEAGFRIFDLPLPFVTPPSITLPAHDRFGWPHGDDYSPLLKARTPLKSTRSVFRAFKFSRLHHALSMSEFRVLSKLMFFPYAIDLREQYGVYDRKAFWRAKADGKRMRRSNLMTIDVIVTYVQPPDYRPRYHAISVKHPGYRPDDTDIAREHREREVTAERGWTWELMRGDAVPMTEFVNYQWLFGIARYQNVPSLYTAAREFAPVVLRSSNRGCLDAVMRRVAGKMGMSLDDTYLRFAVAVAYGFLRLDHNYELNSNLTLRLIR